MTHLNNRFHFQYNYLYKVSEFRWAKKILVIYLITMAATAIETYFPGNITEMCLMHWSPHSLNFYSFYRMVSGTLEPIS